MQNLNWYSRFDTAHCGHRSRRFCGKTESWVSFRASYRNCCAIWRASHWLVQHATSSIDTTFVTPAIAPTLLDSFNSFIPVCCIRCKSSRLVWSSLVRGMFLLRYIFFLENRKICFHFFSTRLQAGQPPQMQVYYNWSECWKHLSSINEHKRGSSLFWRYYQPKTYSDRSSIPFPQLSRY